MDTNWVYEELAALREKITALELRFAAHLQAAQHIDLDADTDEFVTIATQWTPPPDGNETQT